MDRSESEFRRVSSALDRLLASAEQELRCADVLLEDRSARTYHYKLDHLLWAYSFLKEWRVEAERARVTVSLTYGESVNPGATAEVDLAWRAELFQQGHESRIDRKGKYQCPFADIQRQGIASLVMTAIREGAGYLPALSTLR